MAHPRATEMAVRPSEAAGRYVKKKMPIQNGRLLR